jgi:hypothetical protein
MKKLVMVMAYLYTKSPYIMRKSYEQIVLLVLILVLDIWLSWSLLFALYSLAMLHYGPIVWRAYKWQCAYLKFIQAERIEKELKQQTLLRIENEEHDMKAFGDVRERVARGEYKRAWHCAKIMHTEHVELMAVQYVIDHWERSDSPPKWCMRCEDPYAVGNGVLCRPCSLWTTHLI